MLPKIHNNFKELKQYPKIKENCPNVAIDSNIAKLKKLQKFLEEDSLCKIKTEIKSVIVIDK
jgi:hypothetical protein